jgi:hypothetical protein
MNFYKLGMLAAFEKFAIRSTASDLPPFSGMLDPSIQREMNQDVLDLYRKMSPAARGKLNPMEQMQVGNLSADPRFKPKAIATTAPPPMAGMPKPLALPRKG